MSLRIRSALIAFSIAGATSACATSVPPQLVSARDAYRDASYGPAAQSAPAELKTAEQALRRAEVSFEEDGANADTNDLAYIAQRRAVIATAVANRKIAAAQTVRLEAQRVEVSDAMRVEAVNKLQTTKTELGREEERSANERTARLQAERNTDVANRETEHAKADADAARAKVAEMRTALARSAQLIENERGLVITLASSVLFASGRSDVLPAVGGRLSEIAQFFRATPERRVFVEGHTDSVGSEAYNQVLSQLRADSLRTYLIMQGVPADRVSAIGYGESRPVASNATIEGRTNNRRVEIVLATPPGPVSLP